MILVSTPPYFPEQARHIQRQFSMTMIDPAELARLRGCHARGDAQLEQLVTMVHRFAANYEDVNFTPALLASIAADTLIVFGDRDPLTRSRLPSTCVWRSHGPTSGSCPMAGTVQCSVTRLRSLRRPPSDSCGENGV